MAYLETPAELPPGSSLIRRPHTGDSDDLEGLQPLCRTLVLLCVGVPHAAALAAALLALHSRQTGQNDG